MKDRLKKQCTWITAALLFAVLLLAVSAKAEQPERDALPEWTVMFYLCGSDLESEHSYATGNLKEILSCNSYGFMRNMYRVLNGIEQEKERPAVNVVIQTGGTREWHAREIGMDIATDRLQRWHLQGAEQILGDSKNKFVLDDELPLASMAASETLTDFIRWGAAVYPAKKYALVLWDHGGGAKSGLFVDELFGGDMMYLDELHRAMSDGGVKMEAILFDACLMANLETACAVQEYSRWMIGSEELVAGNGTAIGRWLQQLFCIPQWDGERLGRWICDMTQKKYGEEADPQAQDTLTWSVIDLSRIPKVLEYFDRFFEWVGRTYAENPSVMMTVAIDMNSLFEFGLGNDNMCDLAELFYREYIAGMIDPEIYSGMLDALMEAVVYTTRATGRSRALGLSYYCVGGNTVGDLKQYANNCPSPHYLAFLDAITPGWTAPEQVYELAERLPDIREIKEYRLIVRKTIDNDGTPTVSIEEGYHNLRFVRADLYRVNEESGNLVRMGSILATPTMEDGTDNIEYTIGRFWKWPAVEGVNCNVEITNRYMDTDTYNIPIRVGSEQHLLRFGLDIQTKELKIYGLWGGYETDGSVFNRSTKTLSELAGREFMLLYPIVGTEKTGRIKYEVSTPMLMYRTLRISKKDLPAGTYYIDYRVEDIFRHNLEVGRASLEWDGEKIFLQPGTAWEGTMELTMQER